MGADASVKASNRMFDRSVEPEDLILLAAADGRGTRGRWPWEDTEPVSYTHLDVYKRQVRGHHARHTEQRIRDQHPRSGRVHPPHAGGKGRVV